MSYLKKGLLDEKEVAIELAVSVSWLQKGRVYGYGPEYIRIGRHIRYEPSTLEKYKADRRIDPHFRGGGRA